MAHVDNLRRHFPALRHVTYLNTGSYGALPDVSVNAMKNVLDWQLTEGRRKDNYVPELLRIQNSVRELLGQTFHAPGANFALTESTTHAINIVVNGLPLFPGDEIIITDVEHQGVLIPTFVQKQRRGVTVKVVTGAQTADALCDAVEAQLTKRTKLLIVSHVSYLTGHRLPIERLTKLAHANDVWILIDGAQGAGVEAIDLLQLGCDFYALPGQKWLCGPDGTGALYIKSELLSVLDPTYAGYPTLKAPDAYSLHGSFVSPHEAKRYEHSFVNLANWRGFQVSLHLLKVTVGWDYSYTRINGLTGKLMDRLLDFSQVRLITPREARAGLVHFQFGDADAIKLEKNLREREIDVRAIPDINAIRVAPGFYNSEDDLERLVSSLTKI